jgi:hypothetical protein
MSIIETIERGSDNFKALRLEQLSITVGLVMLPRLTEVEMIARARAWCKGQEPPIEDADLTKVQEEAFLLWKSLVHPDQPWKEVTGGKVPNLLFGTVEEMERKLTGDWCDWLSEELVKFREEVSPFSSAKTRPALDALLEEIRKKREIPERHLEIFRVAYCARHGMLPTERRVREMTPDQWWLIYYSLPEHELAAALNSPLFGTMKKEP